MYLRVNTFMLLGLLCSRMVRAEAEQEEAVTETTWRAQKRLKIYRKARTKSGNRGTIYGGQHFSARLTTKTKNCAGGWGEVKGGFVCLTNAKQAQQKPLSLPLPLEVSPPFDDNDEPVIATAEDPAFSPSLHARRLDEDRGRMWASVEAYVAGERANWKLKEGRDYRFVDAVNTEKGWVLVRSNRKAVPLDEVTLYPASRFSGRDLRAEPLDPGTVLGWLFEESSLHMNPSGDEFATIAAQTPVAILDQEEFDWAEVLIDDAYGYVEKEKLRIWSKASLPEDVSEEERWIDVNLDEQMLTVYDGTEPLFITLISSAKKGYVTPTGLYRIYDKSTGWDLASLPNSSDPYFLERVPFVMHYFPRYALHSAFWHSDFGKEASHGCINLSMKDAEVVFDLVRPELPDGWSFVRQRPELPGTVVQIRAEDKPLPDRRILK